MKSTVLIFSATTFADGMGGHYRSLVSLASAAKKVGYDIAIVNFGKSLNKVFMESNIETYNIDIDLGIKGVKSSLKSLSIFSDFGLIHCFDTISYYYLSTITKRILLTKCGGRNPKFFYPYSKYLTVFSAEDYSYFRDNKRFANTTLLQVSNRVEPFLVDHEKISILKEKLAIDEDAFVLLKISRITDYYITHIIQTIDLKRKLQTNFPEKRIVLILVGAVHDNDTQSKLNNYIEDDDGIFFICDEHFTTNAKSILPVCDIYVGSGRSLMEACSLGLPVATHAVNGEVPVLIDKGNYLPFYNTNFSGRSSFLESDQSRLTSFIESIKNNSKLAKFSNDSFGLYEALFSIDAAFHRYLALYEQIVDANDNKMSTIERLVFKFYVRTKLKKELGKL